MRAPLLARFLRLAAGPATSASYLRHSLDDYRVKHGAGVRGAASGGTKHTQHIAEKRGCASIRTRRQLNGAAPAALRTGLAFMTATTANLASASGLKDPTAKQGHDQELILVTPVFRQVRSLRQAAGQYRDMMTSRMRRTCRTPAQFHHHRRRHQQKDHRTTMSIVRRVVAAVLTSILLIPWMIVAESIEKVVKELRGKEQYHDENENNDHDATIMVHRLMLETNPIGHHGTLVTHAARCVQVMTELYDEHSGSFTFDGGTPRGHRWSASFARPVFRPTSSQGSPALSIRAACAACGCDLHLMLPPQQG